jgi:tetratricopeptide (TPR) repeat protein
MKKISDFLRRIKGVSTPLGGISWSSAPDAVNETKGSLAFANIAIPSLPGKNIGRSQKEKPSHYPFQADCTIYLDYSCANPVLDVTIINSSTKPILLTSLGIEVVSVAQVWWIAGIIEPYTVKVDAIASITMPDTWSILKQRGVMPQKIETLSDVANNIGPEKINEKLLAGLPDPILLDVNSPYRYVLILSDYAARMPDCAILKLIVGTDRGQIESKQMFIQTHSHILHAIGKEEKDANDLADKLVREADVFFQKEQYEQAEELMLKALTLHERIGHDTSEVARIKHNLGIIAFRCKNYAKAERLLKDALPKMRERFSDNDKMLEPIINDLVAAYTASGKTAEAEELLEENPVSYSHKGEPTIRPEVLSLIERLEQKGENLKAIQISSRILSAAERYYGHKSPAIASWLNRMGAMCYRANNLTEAANLFRRALHIQENLSSDNPSYLAQYLNNLASVLRDQKSYSESEQLYQRAISILETLNDDDNLAFTLRAYSRLLERIGRTSEAMRIESRADNLER